MFQGNSGDILCGTSKSTCAVKIFVIIFSIAICKISRKRQNSGKIPFQKITEKWNLLTGTKYASRLSLSQVLPWLRTFSAGLRLFWMHENSCNLQIKIINIMEKFTPSFLSQKIFTPHNKNGILMYSNFQKLKHKIVEYRSKVKKINLLMYLDFTYGNFLFHCHLNSKIVNFSQIFLYTYLYMNLKSTLVF